MIVWRLESKEKTPNNPKLKNVNEGAYGTFQGHWESLGGLADGSDGCPNTTHPTPENDMKLSRNIPSNIRDYVFVFDTLRDLHNGFSELEKVPDVDEWARIGVYRVPNENHISGTFQSLARASEMHLIEIQKCTFGI